MRPMTSTAVWLNGSLVDPDAASVSVFDHGFTVGDGVFETLKSIDGVPFAVRRRCGR
jgi:branched-chain amino acid aminotransferase